MCFVVFAVINIAYLPVGNFSPVELLSDQLYSDVEKWYSGVEKPVLVYHGLSTDVECVPTNTAVNTKNNEHEFKYTWLDDNGHAVVSSRFTRLPGGVLHLSSSALEDTGFYTCVVEPLKLSDHNTEATRLSSAIDTLSSVHTPASTKVITSQQPYPDVENIYKGLMQYRHSLIVFRMPTISLQYLYVYKVPMCDRERMTMKMNWFQQKKVTVAKSSDKILQRFSIRLDSPNCSVITTAEPGGWTSMRSTFVLVAQVTVEGNDVIFRTPVCDVECLKLQAVKLLLNVSLLTAERWRDDEKNSKIHEDLILSGEPIFPEFEFDASKFGYAVNVECGYGYRPLGAARAVCVPCLHGTFYDKLNDTCVPCLNGFYQNKMAKLRCEPCPDELSTDKPGARNVSACYRHRWLHSIPNHYALFALFVLIVFVVNLFYVLIRRHHHIGHHDDGTSGNHNENRRSAVNDSSDDDGGEVTQWTMPSVAGWNTQSLMAVDSKRSGNQEILPLLTSTVGTGGER